jgi:hypothetical protein
MSQVFCDVTVCRLACGSCSFKERQLFFLKDQGIQESINPQTTFHEKMKQL